MPNVSFFDWKIRFERWNCFSMQWKFAWVLNFSHSGWVSISIYRWRWFFYLLRKSKFTPSQFEKTNLCATHGVYFIQWNQSVLIGRKPFLFEKHTNYSKVISNQTPPIRAGYLVSKCRYTFSIMEIVHGILSSCHYNFIRISPSNSIRMILIIVVLI